jgi:Icc-related predicted phosphoesterase
LQVRVLALADKRPPVDPAAMALQAQVDAVVCLGDLDRAWIESLASARLPKLGVHGNHDPDHVLREVEVEDLHMRRTSLGGLTFSGFEGCVRYSRSANHQYTQKEAAKLARKLPAADVLLCHCPPRGINDDPDDPAHVGFDGLRDWVDRHHPRHILHGHTHPMPGRVMTRLGGTQVHYVSGARIIQLN